MTTLLRLATARTSPLAASTHSAAAEACPYFPGGPVRVHWGYPDPSNAPEAGRKAAFELTRQAIGYRMLQLLQLPLATMSDAQLHQSLVAIARD